MCCVRSYGVASLGKLCVTHVVRFVCMRALCGCVCDVNCEGCVYCVCSEYCECCVCVSCVCV